MKFNKIGAALSNLLGIDTSELTEVEIAAAIEDAANSNEVVEVVTDTNEVVTETANTATDYAELISALTTRLEEAENAVENMSNLVTVLTKKVTTLSVTSAAPVKATSTTVAVEKLNKAVTDVAETTKETKPLNINEFAEVASIK